MIHVERRQDVLVVTLDRPERRNALDLDHCVELADLVRTAPGQGARAVVVAGAGPHFCAGADLSGVEDSGFVAALHDALETLATVPIPTLAAVHGAALGAGTQLAVACDLRVAEPDARFGIPAARLGLMVDHWTVERLAQLAGRGAATAMLIAAEEYDGAEAHRLGLVHRLGDRAAALAWAEDVTHLAPLTMAGHKLGLNAPGDRSAYGDAFARAWASRDLAEGMAARAEHRPPAFEGR
ncbi:MAG TPA: enoyl-CoA hydratase [Acidimicrobiales bacterium]